MEIAYVNQKRITLDDEYVIFVRTFEFSGQEKIKKTKVSAVIGCAIFNKMNLASSGFTNEGNDPISEKLCCDTLSIFSRSSFNSKKLFNSEELNLWSSKSTSGLISNYRFQWSLHMKISSK